MTRFGCWLRYRFLRRFRLWVGRGPWIRQIDAGLADVRTEAGLDSWTWHVVDGKVKYGCDPDDPVARMEQRRTIRESRGSKDWTTAYRSRREAEESRQ